MIAPSDLVSDPGHGHSAPLPHCAEQLLIGNPDLGPNQGFLDPANAGVMSVWEI